MNENIIEQLAEIIKQELNLVTADLGVLEHAVRQKLQILGQGLLQRLVDNRSNGYQGSSISCKCGGSMKFIQHRPRGIHSIFGWITVRRAYYYCPDCRTGLAPYDSSCGLSEQQLSPALAEVCCLLSVDDSFEQVSLKLRQLLGQFVSDDTIKEVVHKAGSVAIARQEKGLKEYFEKKIIPPPEAKPHRLYITADGTTVHQNDGWHEAKTGCIYWDNERFERIKRYMGGFEDSQKFGWHLWHQACICGLRQADEVVYIGDGAGWVRSEHLRHFSTATFIIDWYHASEHIWDCGKSLFGEGTDAAKKWAEKLLNLLWDGWTRKLLKFLEKQRGKYRGEKLEAIETLERYISVNEEQMRYDVFRAKGYDIGSGAVEGACKYVVGKRLKQSGMIWSRTGSSAVLALRIVWLNGQWEQLWQSKPLAA